MNLPRRIGHGYDIHRLQTGGRLVLGGVGVSDQLSPISHSDGDVVIHAIVDAIFGALAIGDIGEHFSDGDPTLKGIDSRHFLLDAHARMIKAGFAVGNLDITIMAEKPKIAPFKKQMIQSLRKTLGAACIINIKAGTNEGCDAVGRGEAIAAHAVVLLISSN